MPVEPPSPTACPGCGAVLAAAGEAPRRPQPGASPACARLFEVTLRGLRGDGDAAAVATLQLADDAYDAQHPVREDPDRLRQALARLLDATPEEPVERPARWRMTVADVAADLDVIDLPALVESWADAVRTDWTAPVGER